MGDLRLVISRWFKQNFLCRHEYKVDKASVNLPMSIVYWCEKCGRFSKKG